MKAENNSSQNSSVLFWEHLLLKLEAKLDELLENKQKYLKKLRLLPFDELTENKVKQIKILEAEIGLFIEFFATMEELRLAYVTETAKNSELLILLTCQNRAMKTENRLLSIEVLDLKTEVQMLNQLGDKLLSVSIHRKKEVKNVE